jgi:FlaA1/EpsC-like NDP-sugar epimerase
MPGRFKQQSRRAFFNRNFAIILTIDLLLLSISWVAAYAIRFEFEIPVKFIDEMLVLLPVAVATKIACLYVFDVYRGMWRFTGVNDLLGIIKAVSLSALLIIVWALLIYRFKNVPRSVVFIDWGFNILLISGTRMAIRLFFQKYVPTNPILHLPLLQEAKALPISTRKNF